MKLQNNAVSSSSPRENARVNIHVKTIGCMSGIIHFVCKSRTPSRLITVGRKLFKDGSSFPAKDDLSVVQEEENTKEQKANVRHSPRLSRSPTLPAEIRRRNPVQHPPESVAEKKERLLGALRQCDEDLKALKEIIEAVRSADLLRTPSLVIPRSASWFGDNIRTDSEVRCSEFEGEQQPSVASVLNAFERLPSSLSSYSVPHSNGRMQQQLAKKAEEEIRSTYLNKIMRSKFADSESEDEYESVMWSCKVITIESIVEQLCRDLAWGENREIATIGLALLDHISRDLIEEIVTDLDVVAFTPCPYNKTHCF